MQIVDSHCHLNDARLSGDLDAIIARANAADVRVLQTICTTKTEFPEVLAIAEHYPAVYCSYGVHPHHVDEEHATEEDILKAAAHNKVIGIGETGLDYFYENAPRDLQRESFKRHIRAARELDLPVIIHTRDAEEDTISIMDEMRAEGPFKALFHCFSSSEKLAEYGVKNKVYFSASGILTFKKSEGLREIFHNIPLELLLVETDAPYLAPEPNRGKVCEPAFTALTAQRLADLKNVSLEELAALTTKNFFTLFSKAQVKE